MTGSDALEGRHTLIVGLGNEYRRDDAAGLVVARRLSAMRTPPLRMAERELAPQSVRVLEESGEGAALIESWRDAGAVILIDAVSSGAKPGTIHRFDAHAGPVAGKFFRFSTHAFGLAEAVELARALGRLPPRLIVYGIEGKSFEAGEGLTPEVEAAVGEVVRRVLGEVGLSA